MTWRDKYSTLQMKVNLANWNAKNCEKNSHSHSHLHFALTAEFFPLANSQRIRCENGAKNLWTRCEKNAKSGAKKMRTRCEKLQWENCAKTVRKKCENPAKKVRKPCEKSAKAMRKKCENHAKSVRKRSETDPKNRYRICTRQSDHMAWRGMVNNTDP